MPDVINTKLSTTVRIVEDLGTLSEKMSMVWEYSAINVMLAEPVFGVTLVELKTP
ncbi:MAG: hypothetical protein AB7F88_02895 [Pyrinomonadaceae bacterium]